MFPLHHLAVLSKVSGGLALNLWVARGWMMRAAEQHAALEAMVLDTYIEILSARYGSVSLPVKTKVDDGGAAWRCLPC
jgi:hypothetical protein